MADPLNVLCVRVFQRCQNPEDLYVRSTKQNIIMDDFLVKVLTPFNLSHGEPIGINNNGSNRSSNAQVLHGDARKGGGGGDYLNLKKNRRKSAATAAVASCSSKQTPSSASTKMPMPVMTEKGLDCLASYMGTKRPLFSVSIATGRALVVYDDSDEDGYQSIEFERK